ncbi:glycosyl hydrolase [Paenibacillus sp. MWE-103]|uniref:Glycosyl hydrolase n=1 Tax=Paenibacillus artemisiicola TaxID=1172618 RepID=A0ABS3WI47_9BACL|nr:glycosyl hydrolase family 18 protein [Paenibacillus artemisiicola]MBO7748004.1 glycosyl hydrolase [Paenibacillus artemisiicola]
MPGIRKSGRPGRRTAGLLGLAAAALAAAIVAIYAASDRHGRDDAGRPSGEGAVPAAPPLALSAWIVDWQWEAGLADFADVAPGLDGVQAFAAYFDDKDGLYLTEEDRKALPEVLAAAKKAGLRQAALTVVNDRYAADGTPAAEKDPALVSRLLATEASRGKHLSDLMAAVDTYGFGGLELDYERVPDGDWANFAVFIGDLYGRLQAEGKTLRVVLEPRAPLADVELPAGPAYVMMAYNLYGGFSGPGPKADDAFIAQVAARMEGLPGDKAIALSLGGFDWTADKQATAVTEAQAAELARGPGAEPAARDAASGSLHFRYADGKGKVHTVWYADAETVKRWIGAARDAGVHEIALWRLGGLTAEMRDFVRGAKAAYDPSPAGGGRAGGESAPASKSSSGDAP